MADMADILLTVGVNTATSLEEFQKGISGLVGKLDDNPPKIKVDFEIDKSALTNLQKQINDVCKKIDTTANVKTSRTSSTQSTKGATNTKVDTSAIQASTQEINKNTQATNKNSQASRENIATTKQKEQAVKSYLNTINSVESSIKKWTKAENSKNNESRNAYRALKDEATALKDTYAEFARIPESDVTVGDVERLSGAASKANIQLSQTKNVLTSTGDATKSLTDRVGGLAEKFSTWFSVSQAIMAAYRAVKQMVSSVIELDTAMTELRKVTDETESTYDKFLENAASRAKNIGASLSETVQTSADFARIGLSLKDAEKAADAALVYKNVGDGIDSVDTASAHIISTMQVFKDEITSAMDIVDKFNNVGNNFAIGTDGIGEALLRSASAMKVAGNSIDETIALVTAANTTIQNPEKVGTAMKTISMYLRAAKIEAEDAGESTDGMANSVSELRDKILDLTNNKVDIQIDENTFKSTYQILKEISEVWHSLKDVDTAALIELMGGKRNTNVLAGIMKNFSIAEEALKTSADSAGSALEENAKKLESIEGRITTFKTTFQELSQNLIGGDFVKGIVSAGTGLLNILNFVAQIIGKVGGLNTVLMTTAAIIATIKADALIASAKSAVDFFISGFQKIGSALLKTKSAFGIFKDFSKTSLGSSQSALERLTKSFNAAGISATKAQVGFGLVAAGIAVVTTAIGTYQAVHEKMVRQWQESVDRGKETASRSQEISSLIDSYNQLTEAVQTDAGAESQLSSVKDELINKLGLEQKQLDSLTQTYDSYTDALRVAAAQKLGENTVDLKDAVVSSEKLLVDAGHNPWNTFLTQDSLISMSILDLTDDAIKAMDALEDSKLFTTLKSGVKGHSSITMNGVSSDDIKSAEGILKIYDNLRESLDIVSKEVGTDNVVYEELSYQYNLIKDEVKGYSDAVGDLNKNTAEKYAQEKLIGKTIPKTKKEFEEYKKEVLDAAKKSKDFAGTTEDLENAIDDVLRNDINFAKFYTGVSEGAKKASSDIQTQISNNRALSNEIKAVNDIIYSQASGKSISLEAYNSDELKDYRDALELVNGALQLNVEKVREIEKAKTEEQVAINNTNKALDQSKYLENAKKIQKLREEISEFDRRAGASSDLKAKRDELTSLLAENETLAENCRQYDILSANLREAASAYQHFLNSQNAPDYGDMADSAAGAMELIRKTFDSGSEIYGNFGSKKFSAAVEFVIPESVDSDDLSAIESYMNDFQQYLTFDDSGNATGLDVGTFLNKSVEAGLMTLENGEYKIAGRKVASDFAEGLNMSSGMVQAFFDELKLKGANFNFNDELVQTFGDLAVKANESAEALRKIEGNSDLKIKMDVSDLEKPGEKIEALDATIEEMNQVKIGADATEVEYANDIIEYCVTQKQLLNEPSVMKVNTSQCSAEIGEVISLLQEFQTAQNDLEILQSIGADTTNAQAEVDALTAKIQNQKPKIEATLGCKLDATSASSIATSLQTIKPEILVKAGVDETAIIGYQPGSKDCDVVYHPKTDGLPISFEPIDRDVYYQATGISELPTSFSVIPRYVNYIPIGDHEVNGTAHVSGTAHISGIARAGGDWGTAPGGNTLVGELGREIVVDPRSGKWYTVGDIGAEFVNIPPGSIVFNHKQTESLLSNGYVLGRARAMVNGTAMVTGSYKPYNPSASSSSSYSGGYSSGSSGSYISSTGSSSSEAKNSTSDDKEESEFERLYKYHQHLLAMDAENVEDYLTWLNKAYKDAYKRNEIELDDYYKYEEEVYSKLQDVFKDYLEDIEHEISMRENYEGESSKIISLYEGLIKDVEKEIDAARAKGLDNTDDYIQELQDKWQEYSESIKELREESTENAKDAISELVDYRIDMLKQSVEDEQDALDKRLDNLKDFYDKQKELLEDKKDEEKYLKEQSEKRKDVSDIESEIAMLKNDNSAWAQKRKLELQEELAEAKDDLNTFEDDHAFDLAIEALDKAYEKQESKINAEIEALDKKINDPQALYNKALADIKTNTGNLYNEMLKYNRKYGSGNDDDVKDIYEEAYKALQEYKDIHGENYKGIILPNSTKPETNTGSWESEKISGLVPESDKNESGSTKPSVAPGSTVTVKKTATHFGSMSNNIKMASFVPGGKYTVYETSGDQVLIGLNGVYTGWIKKTDIVGYSSGTRNATAGLHRLDELGAEYLFTSSDGSKYRVLNSGDKVLNARATEFLYEFATSSGGILKNMIKDVFGTGIHDNICPVINNNQITMGDVIVQGSADNRTVSEIRRAQRNNLTDMLKSLNKLNK